MIDLARMKGWRVDPVSRTAHAEAGLTLAELDHDCQVFDLFWAVRDGGANLGVVTSFEDRLHEVGPVLGGGIAWSLATCPSPYTQIGVQQMHGQAARVLPTETALVHRHDQWGCLMLTQWDDPADDKRNIR